MRIAAVCLATAVLFGVATHLVFLFGSPYWATDKQIDNWLSRGMAWNTLTFSPIPKAGSTTVPLANPDAFSSRAIIDLKKGPQVLEGPFPPSCTYWSASVFAHNTDTALIMSDRDFPTGLVKIGIARSKADIGENIDAIAVLDSDKAVLLLRCFMRDRTDKAYMATLTEERSKMRVRPALAKASS